MTKASQKQSWRRQVRELMRGGAIGAIATIDRETGEPYCALTILAVDHDATPILLLSGLSDHYKNLAQDDRASILFDDARGLTHAMTGARVSVQGSIVESLAPRHRARYLARHPAAVEYADFGDFGFFALQIERVHLVGGFGVAKWLAGKDVYLDVGGAQELIDGERAIVDHMNEDHRQALDLYAAHYLGRENKGWEMTGIDPEGIDLRRQQEFARLAFESSISTPTEARKTLVELVHRGRSEA